MLELLLLRHAKSRWDEPEAGDHERDLAPRGLKAAKRIGVLLREEGLLPDLVLCSDARRAQHTWQLAAAALAEQPSVTYLSRLYLAPPERMIDVIRQRGGSARRLLLVGHNPGLHALAAGLVDAGEGTLRARLAQGFPTGALARIGIAGTSWAGLGPSGGKLLAFWLPRELN